MATRPRESISDLQISGTGAAVLAGLAFLLGYGVRGDESVPAHRSAAPNPEGDITVTLIWGALITLGWVFRDRLREMMLAPQRSRLLLVALAFVPVAIVDALSTQILAAPVDPGCGLPPTPDFSGFLPRVAMFGTTMLLVLLAWEQHLARLPRAPRFEPSFAPPTPAAPGEWLDFPESPLLRIRADDVVLIRSAGNYSEIVAHGRAHLVRATLSELSDRLAPQGFIRVHRQTVINARNVRQVCRDGAGRALIHLSCGNTVPVGRRYVDAIDALTRGI
ncbi:LytTR family DNA-binding domain-containing protein [Sphingomonas sp. UNC305MFCol5.2]|uniref:LytTR family DNA-binding domain-containing protein n=1 Tax=Sphingomonas sp. UNC305MFCol5.2 TaxID=1449076 RepID=UPI0004A7495C|nr:LytTR family DNA-binding domain-containing protein [Sphingomonas sp. UNC305MFCol5.2]